MVTYNLNIALLRRGRGGLGGGTSLNFKLLYKFRSWPPRGGQVDWLEGGVDTRITVSEKEVLRCGKKSSLFHANHRFSQGKHEFFMESSSFDENNECFMKNDDFLSHFEEK